MSQDKYEYFIANSILKTPILYRFQKGQGTEHDRFYKALDENGTRWEEIIISLKEATDKKTTYDAEVNGEVKQDALKIFSGKKYIFFLDSVVCKTIFPPENQKSTYEAQGKRDDLAGTSNPLPTINQKQSIENDDTWLNMDILNICIGMLGITAVALAITVSFYFFIPAFLALTFVAAGLFATLCKNCEITAEDTGSNFAISQN